MCLSRYTLKVFIGSKDEIKAIQLEVKRNT